MIVEGKRLYLDLFDHKGMLAFLPSALGYMMVGYYGVCFVNWLFHLFAAFTMFLLVSELNDDLSFLLYNGSVYLLLWSLIDAGNANGLYVLPFGMLAYCFFLKGFKTKRRLFFLIGSLIGGIEIGMALLSFLCSFSYSFFFFVNAFLFFRMMGLISLSKIFCITRCWPFLDS